MEVIHLDAAKDETPPNYSGIIHYSFNGIKDSVCYFKDGVLHREGGPAFLALRSGTKFWMVNGKFHREDGPAVKRPGEAPGWYANNIRYQTREAWFQVLTPEQKENALWSEDVWK